MIFQKIYLQVNHSIFIESICLNNLENVKILSGEQRLQGAIICHIIGAIYFFTLLAVVCNDYFLPSVECICDDLNIPQVRHLFCFYIFFRSNNWWIMYLKVINGMHKQIIIFIVHFISFGWIIFAHFWMFFIWFITKV